MAKPREGGLEIAEDPHFIQLGWKLQRAGWALIALLVAAGLAGLLGNGPLSSAESASADGMLAVRYERFAHRNAPVQLELRYGPAAVRDGELRVWVDRGFLEKVKIDHATPEPKAARAGPERLTFVFDAEAAAGAITLHFEHQGAGRHSGRIGAGAAELALGFFVYP